MGKKKQKKLAKKVDRWMIKRGVTEEDLSLAGLGVLSAAVSKGSKKRFKKMKERGEKLAVHGVGALETAPGTESGPEEPVISYASVGGGWYSVAVDNIEVDRVQGEESAAARAGELLERYAAVNGNAQSVETSIDHAGGGWYEVTVRGVPVARVRGRDEVEERFGHLLARN